MKECKYCRSKYDDNLAACPNCGGTKIVTAEELEEEAAIERREHEYREKANAAPKVHKKRVIGILTAVVVVIIAVIAVASINANKPLSNGMTKDEGEEILASGMAYFDNGQYEEAIQCFAQLPSDSKQYEEAQSMLTKSSEAYRDSILDKVNNYVQNDEYEVALELLNNAQKVLPDDADLKNAYNITFGSYKSLISSTAITEADEFAADGNYESAIKTVSAALDKIGQDEELSAKLAVYGNTYRDVVVAQADNILRTEGYQEALTVLNQGLTVLPDDAVLLDKIETYRTYTPVPLSSFESYEDSYTGISQLTSCEDRQRNVYSDGYYGAWGGCYSKYLLDYQYGQLSCDFVMLKVENVQHLNNEMIVVIYGDDDVVLYSGALKVGETETLSLKVDISNVKWLKIYMDCYYEEPLAALVNVNFTKTYD